MFLCTAGSTVQVGGGGVVYGVFFLRHYSGSLCQVQGRFYSGELYMYIYTNVHVQYMYVMYFYS